MAFGSVVVIRSMQRARERRSKSHRKLAADEVDRKDENDQERRRVVARNADLPRFSGTLLEKHRSLLGSKSEQLRWVTLDPAEATLSVWEGPPSEAGSPGSSFSGSSPPPGKVSRKGRAYSMAKLVEVDSNPSFRNIFLRFEGASHLSLVAESDEDFQRWMDAFTVYDWSLPSFMSESPAVDNEVLPDISPLCHVSVRDRNESGGRNAPPCNFETAYHQCFMDEPSPEPAPGFRDWCNQAEEYDTGAMESKAVMPSMGIINQTKGLSPRFAGKL